MSQKNSPLLYCALYKIWISSKGFGTTPTQKHYPDKRRSSLSLVSAEKRHHHHDKSQNPSTPIIMMMMIFFDWLEYYCLTYATRAHIWLSKDGKCPHDMLHKHHDNVLFFGSGLIVLDAPKGLPVVKYGRFLIKHRPSLVRVINNPGSGATEKKRSIIQRELQFDAGCIL